MSTDGQRGGLAPGVGERQRRELSGFRGLMQVDGIYRIGEGVDFI